MSCALTFAYLLCSTPLLFLQKQKSKSMNNSPSFYSRSRDTRKRPQYSSTEADDAVYGSKLSKSLKYTPLVESDDEGLQISELSQEVVDFIADIQYQNASGSTQYDALTMAKALQKGTKYNIVDIRAVDTRYGDRQVWKVQKRNGEKEFTEVWTPYSASKHVTDTEGAVCERKKALMLQTILHYRGFEGPAERPTRYILDFLAH